MLSAMVSVSMTKLCLKAKSIPAILKNEVLFVLSNLFKLVQQNACGGERSGSAVRIAQCVRTLVAINGNKLEDNQKAAAQFLQGEWGSNNGRMQLSNVLDLSTQNSEYILGSGAVEVEEKHVAPDEGIVFRQLLQRTAGADIIDDDDDFKMARMSDGGASGAADG